MGYAVQVDPDVLAAGARRLTAASQMLDTLADRVLGLCLAACAGMGGAELSAALEAAGRETAGAVGRGASLVATLGAATEQAGAEYRLLEQALTSRWGGAA